jgi:hypothetical protein
MPTETQPTLQTPTEVRARLAELKHDFLEIPATERSDEDNNRYRSIMSEVDELDKRMGTLAIFDAREHAPAPNAATRNHGGMERRSGGQLLVESDEFRDWTAHGLKGQFNTTLEVGIRGFQGGMEFRTPVTDFGTTGPGYTFGNPAYDSTGSGMLLPVGEPIAPIPRQAKLYLRDLIPTTSTTLASIPYVRELSPTSYEGAATSVAEGSTKPTATLSFSGAKADPTVLATSLQLSKQLFQDAPAVVQYVNNRLPYMVKYREDQEFLNGNGTWPDMQGILNVPGIGTQAAVNSDDAQTLAVAFAQIENEDGAVSAVVMNPTNAWNMYAKRAAGGSGTFDAGTPFASLPMTVWGVPVYRTRAMPAGTALAADFQRGAQIFDREQVNMQVYQERYAEQNLVFLLCEERVGVAWYRPDLFVSCVIPS